VRGAARGLIVALASVLGLASTTATPPPCRADMLRAMRALDGSQFLEDEPIWLYDAEATDPGASLGFLDLPFRLVGVDDRGRSIRLGQSRKPDRGNATRPRAGELGASFLQAPRPELHPLGPGPLGGLRAGRYEVRPAVGDTGRVLATFRVIEPRGSELAVRAALARAARLAAASGPTNLLALESRRRAARLYEAVLARYPRTSYRTTIFAMLWRIREASSNDDDDGLWLDEVFAQFHNTAFGVWALDRFMADDPFPDRERLRRLVGLYPDTQLSRAAARYL
jgi:hypothetical protein